MIGSFFARKSYGKIKGTPVEREISWYIIRKPIAEAMLKCEKLGFEPAGHGCGFGGEDFNLANKDKDLYVNFQDQGKKCHVRVGTFHTVDEDGMPVTLFEGTIKKSLVFIESYIKFQSLNQKCDIWKTIKGDQ